MNRRLGLLATALACSLAGFAAVSRADGPVEVTAGKILNFRLGGTETRFGGLEFVGGLQLSSDSKDFGGFSGVRLVDGERLLMVTDKCRFFSATLTRDATGAPHDIVGAELRPLPPAPNGKSLRRLGLGDCEALEAAGGKAFVSFEQGSQIGMFDLSEGARLSNYRNATPPGKKVRFAGNKGLEAIALFPAGSHLAGKLLMIAEETLDGNGDHLAFFGDGKGRSAFTVARSDNFSVTDADFLPDGRLVTLERRFGLKVEPAFRIRVFDTARIAEGVRLEGETLVEAGLAYRIDNMEGIDAWLDAEGRTRLTLVSDDNFNFFQSTIVLEFLLAQ